MALRLSRRVVVGGMVAGVAATTAPIGASAQQPFTGRTVRLIVEYPSGSGPDIVGRLVAIRLSQVLGGTFYVESRAGASGRIAAQAVASSPADGSTLLLMTATQTIIAATDREIRYDLLKDFAFVSMLVEYPFFIFVSAKSPYKTFDNLLGAARRNPGKITYSSAGIGSTMHLAMEVMLKSAGAMMVHVPGGSQQITDVQNQEIDCGIVSLGAISELVRADYLRALAVTSAARDPLAPTVPTIAESGVPAYAVSTWLALAAPAKTSRDLVDRLQDALKTIMAEPEIRERVALMGFSAVTNGPEQMRERVAADMSKWQPFGAVLQR